MKRKGASLLFLNSVGQVLLFLRDNKPEIPFPNCWDVLGGHVEEDEEPQTCIKREMQEEIEVDVVSPRLFNLYDMDDRLEYIFWTQADLDIARLTLHEGQRLKWFSEDDIKGMTDNLFAFNFKPIILDFYRKKPWQSGGKDSST